MVEILQINVRLEITLQTIVSYRSGKFLRTVRFSCSGSRDIGRVPMTSLTGSHPHSKICLNLAK